MKPAALFPGVILAVAGCAQFAPQETALSTPIAPSEVDWARSSGANTVSGIASIKAGGTNHTCAGQSAILIPDSAYARARMTAIFGNATKGMRAASLGPAKFERDDPLYVSTLRTGALRRDGQLLLPARARRCLVRHEQREVAGRLAGRGRLGHAAGRSAWRTDGEGHAALSRTRAASVTC